MEPDGRRCTGVNPGDQLWQPAAFDKLQDGSPVTISTGDQASGQGMKRFEVEEELAGGNAWRSRRSGGNARVGAASSKWEQHSLSPSRPFILRPVATSTV